MSAAPPLTNPCQLLLDLIQCVHSVSNRLPLRLSGLSRCPCSKNASVIVNPHLTYLPVRSNPSYRRWLPTNPFASVGVEIRGQPISNNPCRKAAFSRFLSEDLSAPCQFAEVLHTRIPDESGPAARDGDDTGAGAWQGGIDNHHIDTYHPFSAKLKTGFLGTGYAIRECPIGLASSTNAELQSCTNTNKVFVSGTTPRNIL